MLILLALVVWLNPLLRYCAIGVLSHPVGWGMLAVLGWIMS